MTTRVSSLRGRRIHFAGSVKTGNPEDAGYAHRLVEILVTELATRGATFVVPIDREPRMIEGDSASPASVFDWTVLAAAWSARALRPLASPLGGPFIHAVSHRKSLTEQIPAGRAVLWR